MRFRAIPPIFVLLLSLATLGQERDYAPLAKKAEALRGLTFKHPVPTQVVDGPTLRRVLEAQIKKEYPDSEWPDVEKTLKAFSLIAPKMNLKSVMSALLEEQVVGLYDPDAKKLYVSGAPVADAELLESLGVEGFDLRDVYVLHEMVHALTDQAFDMKSLPLDDKEDEDRASAARCVVEGDATWVMLRYMYDALKIPADQRGQIDDVMFGMNLGKEMMGTSTPAYLQENLLMAYLGGQALVKMAYERGGFDGVNRLYRSPPQSMEQVLHPEKYFAGKDPPVAVPIPAMTAFPSEGWRPVGKGVWGELNARIILQEWGVPEEQARAAAEGWGGDAYRAAEGPGGALGFSWTTVWDTDRDAAEFFEACAGLKGLSVSRAGKRVSVSKGTVAQPQAEKVKQAS
jgi:hypothetical protein